MQTLFLPAVLVLCSFIFTLIILTVYSLWHDEKNKHKSSVAKSPENDQALSLSEKAAEIIDHAQQEARRILAEAELTGIKAVASKKINTTELEKTYEKDLSGLTSEAYKELTIASTELKKRYEQFIIESENIIAHHISQNQARLDAHLTQTLEANDKAFEMFLQSQQQKLDQAFSKEISQVETLVKNYYKKRLELVDSNIVNLITEATKITLSRSLNFKDHTTIILEALEEAKSSGFFGHHDNTT